MKRTLIKITTLSSPTNLENSDSKAVQKEREIRMRKSSIDSIPFNLRESHPGVGGNYLSGKMVPSLNSLMTSNRSDSRHSCHRRKSKSRKTTSQLQAPLSEAELKEQILQGKMDYFYKPYDNKEPKKRFELIQFEEFPIINTNYSNAENGLENGQKHWRRISKHILRKDQNEFSSLLQAVDSKM
uniref:Uncharacterized protein n=4 Tax=Euplotes harpa TaxID=151035 RepID=A0A7S3N5E9_9SPIT